MNLLSQRIKEFLPDWNQRVYTVSDAEEFCERHNIIHFDTENIDGLGKYRIYRGHPFIYINKFIEERYRSWVFWHEISHFILHPTSIAQFSDEVTKRKAEKEANLVASICLMPRAIIDGKRLCEISEEFNYPRKIILIRKHIFDSEKI